MSTTITPTEQTIDINVTEDVIDINVTNNIVDVNATTEQINIEVAGAYPLPATIASVFGRTGEVVATIGDYNTSQVTENTNLYFTNARARGAISLTTIGTSGTATYDNGTGILNVPQYQGGVTSFNTRTGAISLTSADVSGALTYVPYNSSNPSGYITGITSGNVTTALGYTPVTNARTLTINGTAFDLTADRSWTITGAVSSVFGRTGAVVATSGDYTTTQVTEGTNLYYTDARARSSNSFTAGSGAYNSTTGVITIPTNTNQITNGSNYITLASLSGSTGISYNNTTGAISSTITQYTDALSRAAISLTTTGTSGASTYNSTTGVLNIPQYSGGGGGGTVTSVAALTLGTTGTDLSSSVANSTTTPVITLNVPTASATNRGVLASADWTTFNNKANALNGTINTIAYWDSATTIASLALATYPSLTELSYVKGVTSAIQTQLNGKQGTLTLTTTGSSGSATLVGDVLNIPQYSGGGGGSITLAAIGSTPNANAATLTGTVLNLEPASASFGGVITTGTQTFAGAKTFAPSATASGAIVRGTYFNPTLTAAANGDVLAAIDINPTFSLGAFTGLAALAARFNGNVVIGTVPSNISAFSFPPLTLANNATGATKVQLSLVNGGGSAGAGSAIDFFTYTDAGNGLPGVRIISTDDGNFSGDYQIQTKAQGGSGTGALSTKFAIIGGSGNIGIGTTTVGSKIQVNGNAAIGYSASTAAPTNGLLVAGDINISAAGSTQAAPRIIGITNWSVGGNSARITFGDTLNSVSSSLNCRMSIQGYWGVEIYGGRQSLTALGFTTGLTSDASLLVGGSVAANSVLLVQGAASQSGSLQQWRNSGGTALSVVTSTGALGLLTTTVGSSLQVNGNAAIGYSASTAAPTNGLAVSGNVGLGTITIGSKLQVNGNVAIGYSTSKAAPTNGLIVAGTIQSESTAGGSAAGLVVKCIVNYNSVNAVDQRYWDIIAAEPNMLFRAVNDANNSATTYMEVARGSGITVTNINFANGNINIGTSTNLASAKLQVSSTTQGFLPPKMTTTQKNAITTPTAGLIVYDTTLNKLCVYTTAWETITSL